VIHVRNVDGPIRRCRDVDRPEERVGAQDELGSRIYVAELRQTLVLHDPRAANQSADRLGNQQIAAKIRWDAVRPDHVGTRRCREMVDGSDRHPDAHHPTSHVGEPGLRPDNLEARFELLGYGERSVVDGDLEVHGAPLAPGVDEPHLPVIVHRHTPGAAVGAGRLLEDAVGRPAETESVVGRVDPVVKAPVEARLLVLEVAVAAEADARIEMLALVGNPVVVRVLDHVADAVSLVRMLLPSRGTIVRGSTSLSTKTVRLS
jgi:hypothetical protein